MAAKPNCGGCSSSSSSSSSTILGSLNIATLSLCFILLLLCSPSNAAAKDAAAARPEYHLLRVSTLLPSSICDDHSSKEPSRKGTLKLTHRHGPCSQHTSSQAMAKAKPPTAEEMLSQDQSRVDSIHNSRSAAVAFNSGKLDLQGSKVSIPAKSGSTIGSGNYIVTVGLGTPKKDLSLIFDTGSSLTWTQCQPCVKSCYDQQEPIFAPSLSTSYSNITCDSTVCSQLSSTTGVSPGCSSSTCIYGTQYGDQSFSVGFFGKERLTLTATDAIDGFYFGCGQNNRGLFGGAAGLLGLGGNKLSLVSQASQKYGQVFSYCLPSRASLTGYLTLGNSGISTAAKFTPLATGSDFYKIAINAITVGGQQLSIPQTVFTTAGTIIDSGTVITRLPPAAYTALRNAFRVLMRNYPLTTGVSILDTCYDLSNYNSVYIPKISFVFNGNANVDISPSGILYAVDANHICLAFAGNGDASDTSIFGNVQQKTLQVIYNVAGGKLGFAPGGCS